MTAICSAVLDKVIRTLTFCLQIQVGTYIFLVLHEKLNTAWKACSKLCVKDYRQCSLDNNSGSGRRWSILLITLLNIPNIIIDVNFDVVQSVST